MTHFNGSFYLMASSVLDRGVQTIRMKRRVVSTSSVEFIVGVDKESGVLSLEFEDFDSFSHAKGAAQCFERLHTGDRFALPEDLSFSHSSNDTGGHILTVFKMLGHMFTPA